MSTTASQPNQQASQLRKIFDKVKDIAARLKVGRAETMQLMGLEAYTDLLRALTPVSAPEYKTKFINATLAGDTQVVERVEDRKIRVLAFSLNNGGGAVSTVHFRSVARPISSDKALAANGGAMVAPEPQGFWFETAMGEGLNINLAAAGTVGVDVTYVEVEASR